MEYKFGLTIEHECAYLDDQLQQNIVLTEPASLDVNIVSQLNVNGFRRSGDMMYRPQCNECRACESSRVVVGKFKENRSQRRCINANKTLKLNVVDSIAESHYYELYAKYITKRHASGSMFPPSRETYDSFLMPSAYTRYLIASDEHSVLGVLVFDVLYDGLSAVYSFYNTNDEKRAMGKFLILQLIRLASINAKDYVYLGYAVDACARMSYKSDFKPQQRFIDNRWQAI